MAGTVGTLGKKKKGRICMEICRKGDLKGLGALQSGGRQPASRRQRAATGRGVCRSAAAVYGDHYLAAGGRGKGCWPLWMVFAYRQADLTDGFTPDPPSTGECLADDLWGKHHPACAGRGNPGSCCSRPFGRLPGQGWKGLVTDLQGGLWHYYAKFRLCERGCFRI